MPEVQSINSCRTPPTLFPTCQVRVVRLYCACIARLPRDSQDLRARSCLQWTAPGLDPISRPVRSPGPRPYICQLQTTVGSPLSAALDLQLQTPVGSPQPRIYASLRMQWGAPDLDPLYASSRLQWAAPDLDHIYIYTYMCQTLSEVMSDRTSEFASDRMSNFRSDRMSKCMSDRMSTCMSDRMSEAVSDRMSESMPDRT